MSHAEDASRAVLGRGSIYTLASAAPAVTSLVVLPVVTRLLAPAEYGVVAIATVVLQVGLIVAALGLGAAVTRNYFLGPGGAEGARVVVVAGSGIAVLLGLLGVAAGQRLSEPVLALPWQPALAIAVGAASAGASVVLAQAYLRAMDRAGAFVGLAATANLAGPVAGLLLLLTVSRTPASYVVGLLAGQVVAALAGLLIVSRQGFPLSPWAPLAAALRVGLPTLPHQVSLYLAVGGLVVVAQRSLGVGAAGQAQVVLLLGAAPTVLTAALNNAWAPLVYRAPVEKRPALLDRTTRDLAVVTAGLGGVLALSAPWVLAVVLPEAYDPLALVPALAGTTLAGVLSVPYLANGHLVFASGRTAWLAASTPAAVAVGLVVAAASTGVLGVAAVALGYVVTYVGLVLGTTLIRRLVSSTKWRLPPLRAPLLAAAGLATLGAALPATGWPAWLRVALVAGTTVATAKEVRRVLRTGPQGQV